MSRVEIKLMIEAQIARGLSPGEPEPDPDYDPEAVDDFWENPWP